MIKRPIITPISEYLEPLGFVRRKTTWNRRFRSFVDVIELETSKSGNRLTIDGGVVHSATYQKCWREELPAFFHAADCTVRARVGELIEGKDVWWPAREDGVGNAVAVTLSSYMLPFVNSLHSIEAMEQFLVKTEVVKKKDPLPVVYLAILMHQRENTRAACSLLGELANTALGAWKGKSRKIAEELGCLG